MEALAGPQLQDVRPVMQLEKLVHYVLQKSGLGFRAGLGPASSSRGVNGFDISISR